VVKRDRRYPKFGLSTIAVITILLLPVPSNARDGKKSRHETQSSENGAAVLWSNPTDIASRNLFYGPGGKEHEPRPAFTFLEEDRGGTNPKFDVRDENGVKWKVKLGPEAQPETVASRLLWAAGYFANEDYFLSNLRVEHMPQLKRGHKLIGPDGSIHNARLKRNPKGEKKVGEWRWRQNQFTGTRQFNGLRVMMALINNWDLKDENNSVVEEKKGGDKHDPEFHDVVSDLGASFGTAGIIYPIKNSKGNLRNYSNSKFIRRVSGQYVNFTVPARPSLIYLVVPNLFIRRMHLRWIGRHVPREDARWLGQLLAQLSTDQIRDAFRAAGYAPEQVEQFAEVVKKRITELEKL
jgi:hypothetical protein